MKRDMELIRLLLLRLEALDIPPNATATVSPWEDDLTFDGYTTDAVRHHLHMLVDGGFLEVPRSGFDGDGRLMFHRLSWEGHDFLDSVRDPETWRKTRDGALAAGGWTIDLLKDLAKGLAKKKLEEITGVKL